MENRRIYRQAAGLSSESTDDGIVVSNASRTRLTQLNHVGAIVFLLTADALSRSEIIQILRETYGEVEGLDIEVSRCLEDLVESGLAFASEDEGELFPSSSDEEIFTQWLVSDKALAEGRKHDADDIYRAIASRKGETEVDYLYGGLALGRLGLAAEALDRLEAGCRAFPKSQPMRENLISIAAANGQMETLLDTLAADPKEACEHLLALSFCNATIRSALFGHFLASGDLQTARQIAGTAKKDNDGLLAVWLMADAALHHGAADEADRLYRQMGESEPVSEADHLYVGLAFHRLRQTARAIEILQNGRRAFPNSMALLTNLVFVCASSGQIELLYASRRKNESKVRYLTGLVKAMVQSGQSELFMVHHKQYEFSLGKRDFMLLARAFVLLLRDNLPDPKKREVLMFFAQYLDAEPSFARSLHRVLKSGNPDDDFKLDILHRLTSIYIPARNVDAAKVHSQFQAQCKALSDRALVLDDPIRDLTVSFSPWHALFCLCAPKKYAGAMEAYQSFALKTWPQLDYQAPHVLKRPPYRSRKIRIGFMAHPAMPMMSGLMAGLDRARFEPIYLGPGKPDNSYTAKSWQERGSKAVFYDENDMRAAIEAVSAQKLDIVLSAPSQPAVFYPVMAKLAPLHMVVLEPNWTDGFPTSDYYISWKAAEPARPDKFYRSHVAYLDHPPYWIDNRYDFDVKLSERKRHAFLTKLTGKKSSERVYLCPSTPPKLHGLMDEIILGILKKDPEAIVTFLRNDFPPARNLHIRWREKFGKRYERIRFLTTLDRTEAHLLLHAVDCNLDSYPIGGMSSSFDGAILGIPTVTWPADIPFGRWLSSIYDYIGVSGLTAASRDDYVDMAVKLANDRAWRRRKAQEIKSIMC